MMKQDFLTLTPRETGSSLFYLAAQLLVLPGLLTAAAQAAGLTPSPVLLNFVFYLLNFFFMLTICRKTFGRCVKAFLETPGPCLKTGLLYAAAALLLNRLLGQLIGVLDPAFQNLNDSSLADMAHSQWWLLAFSVVVLVPPAEELLFRGAVFGALYRRSRVLAWTVSTLAFSLIHVMGYLGQLSPAALLLSVLQYLPAGFLLALAYRKTGNLFTPVLMHACINLIGILAMR